MHPSARFFVAGLAVPAFVFAQADPDRDGDGLTDFQEVHKYRTDPARADSDGDGVPDGDWLERREYQYVIRSVVQVMRPVTIDHLCDDYQDARVLDETRDYVELEVVHYPFQSVAAAIAPDPDWRNSAAALRRWLEPGPTSDWTPAMQQHLTAALAQDGIDVRRLDDKALVEQVSRWLCAHAKTQDCFTTFVTAFDERGQPFVPKDLLAATGHDQAALERQWPLDVSARGMFERGVRGSCSSSAIYLSGCLRALGIPTRTILTIPLVDANDERELELVERGLTHRELRAKVLPALRRLKGSWSSHTFNEVFVGGRWRRLNYDRLGQDIYDPDLFGVLTHVATFRDWADAQMPDTIGRRQTLRRYDDVFGGPNPYSTIALRDAFGPHCELVVPEPPPIPGKVTAVMWGDGADSPEHIRAWFAKRGVFGLIARIEGPTSFAEVKQLLAANDLRVLLTAPGAPTLGVALDAGAFWWHEDHAMVVVPFGAGDRRDHVADKAYAFVCRNQGDGGKWQIADGVGVPPRTR